MAKKYPKQIVAVVAVEMGDQVVALHEEFEVSQAEVVRLALEHGLPRAAKVLERAAQLAARAAARAITGAA